VAQLTRLHPHRIHDELRAYFRDIYDHVYRVNESISTMRDMLGAAISVKLAFVTFGQKEVMKKLAGWLGGHAGRADPEYQLVRHELRPHARATTTLGLPRHHVPGSLRRRRHLHTPETQQVILTKSALLKEPIHRR
jgi:hypothetical protein